MSARNPPAPPDIWPASRHRTTGSLQRRASVRCEHHAGPAATTEIIGELQGQELARQQEEAEADAELEAERARRAAAWDAMKAANEEALAESIARANESAARNQAMLDAHYRQQQEQGQSRPQSSADATQREGEVEHARQATLRQYEIAREFEARQQAQREAPATPSSGNAPVLSAGGASTRDDTSTCVSAPVIGRSPNPAICTDGYSVSITNACTAPVKVRLCAMTTRGWDCSSNGGVAPGGSWSQAWCHAQPGTFVSSRYADSPEDPDRP